MARRQTIGDNPLDALIQRNNERPRSVSKDEKTETTQKKKSSPKERITVQISVETIERIKNAAYWSRITLASLAEEAFNKVVDELEKEKKTAFPKRKEELKTGRPIN